MMRAGLIDEIMSDAIDGTLGAEDEEEEVDEEVDKVLMEVAGEALAAMPAARRQPVGDWVGDTYE
jgi:charged multivesicular body protein 3